MKRDSIGTDEPLEPATGPHLATGESFDIAEGGVVHPLDYPPGQSTPPFKAAIFVVAPGHATPLDRHEVAETWVILKGAGLLDFEGTTLRVSASDKLFFPSLRSHQVTNDTPSPLEILSVYWPVNALESKP
jgi:mannose-6-phosphate isomerase-like protein (cupin superfamily)